MWEQPLAVLAPHHYAPNQMLVNFPHWLWLSFRARSGPASSGDWPPTAELVRFLRLIPREADTYHDSRLACAVGVMRAVSTPRQRCDFRVSRNYCSCNAPCAASSVLRKFCLSSGAQKRPLDSSKNYLCGAGSRKNGCSWEEDDKRLPACIADYVSDNVATSLVCGLIPSVRSWR